MAKKPTIMDNPVSFPEDELHEAMLQEGWVLATTPKAVLAMESRVAKIVSTLPALLDGDPLSILKRPRRPIQLKPRQPAEYATVLENLARAARDAGDIAPEIEEQMRQDRERAEENDK